MRLHRTIRVAGLVAALVCLVGLPASAKSCFSGADVVPPATVAAEEAALQADPAKWFASKGGNLTRAVRDLAASDSGFAATIVSLHKSTLKPGANVPADQAAAIGAGLGQAKISCNAQIDDASNIQTAASASSENTLIATYNTTIGSTQTGSTGGGGGGGSGGTGIGGGLNAIANGQRSGGSLDSLITSTATRNEFVNLLTSGTGTSVSAANQAAAVNP